MHRFECPPCRKPFEVERADQAPHRPFCSERCKMVDLGRWLDGTYCVSDPTGPMGQPEDEADETL